MRDWGSFRGRAVEPIVRRALERLLADERRGAGLGGARHVGAWWRRDHAIEVDLVGADAPDPTRIGFIGSVKWHDRDPLTAREAAELAGHRAHVPGGAGAKLVAVSRTGFEKEVEADATFGPADLLAAW